MASDVTRQGAMDPAHLRKIDTAVAQQIAEQVAAYLVDQQVVASFAQQSLDAFGSVPVSNKGNRFDVEFLYDLQPKLCEQVKAGSGDIVHNTDGRDVVLSVGDAVDNSSAHLVSAYFVPYTPGAGQEIEATGVLDLAGIGGGTAEIFHRNGIDSSEKTYPQSEWIGAKSGVDWSKSHIFRIDFQSLKVGSVRFSLVQNGEIVPVFQLNNDNTRNTGYWQYASLPLYWKIYNTGGNTVSEIGYGDDSNGVGFRYTITADASATMRAICGTVKSQGGEPLLDMPGFPFGPHSGTSLITVSSSVIPIMSIRPKLTFNSLVNRSLIIPDLVFGYSAANDAILTIFEGTTLTNASWVSAGTNSGVEYDISATAFSGGDMIGSVVIPAGVANLPAVSIKQLREPLSTNYAGDASKILTIAGVRQGTGDATVWCSIEGREIR